MATKVRRIINYQPLKEKEVKARLRSAEAKGHKVFGSVGVFGLRMVVGTKREAKRAKKDLQARGFLVRVTKSKYYGDYNIWTRRK